jgi:hypothetical protein
MNTIGSAPAATIGMAALMVSPSNADFIIAPVSDVRFHYSPIDTTAIFGQK